jgi:hypothetical protein
MTPFFFIDDTTLGKPRDRYLPILGGFIASSSSYDSIRTKLIKLKKKYGLVEKDPIKWSPGQTDKRYTAQRKVRNLNDLRMEVLKLLGESRILIIVSVIDEESLAQPYERIFYLKQSVDHLAKRFHYHIDKRGLEKGIIILDHPGEREEPALAEHYKKIHAEGASSGVHLSSLSDLMCYSHCYACDGLQLADFIVGCLGYTLKHGKYHYFNSIKHRIRAARGNRKGWGLIIFPSNSTKIDILCSG